LKEAVHEFDITLARPLHRPGLVMWFSNTLRETTVRGSPTAPGARRSCA
jgi:hypothetical protein